MNLKINFTNIHNRRKSFIEANKNNDNVILEGKNNILISAPHGVTQVRLGKPKFAEIGALSTALFLKDNSNCYFISKTKNNNDDANFDEFSLYKTNALNLIKEKKIKYVIDIHGLAPYRDCDINLGIHLGKNIEKDVASFDDLYNNLEKSGFITTIDQPFMAGNKTISGSLKEILKDIWTIQIEINCKISNKKEYFGKYCKLLNTLLNWIKTLENKNF